MAIQGFNNLHALSEGEKQNFANAKMTTNKWTTRAYVSAKGENMMAHTTACNKYLATLSTPITKLPLGRMVRKHGGVLTFVMERDGSEEQGRRAQEEAQQERQGAAREEAQEETREETHEPGQDETQEETGNEGENPTNDEQEEQHQETQNDNEEEEPQENTPPTYERTMFDTHPTLEPLHPNNNGGVPLRPKAEQEEINRDPFAVVDHISFNQCYGTAGASFDECERVPWACREMWAEFYGEICNQAVIATEYDHLMSTNQVEYDLFMERRIKMFYLAPTLIFRKLNHGKKNPPYSKKETDGLEE